MNTRELQIGNIVMVGDKVVRVNSITQHKIGYCSEPCRERYARSREVEPIRLNVEVLAHVSFGEVGFTFNFVIIQNEGGTIDIMFPVLEKKFSYLHELQNIYHLLTGSELTMLSE